MRVGALVLALGLAGCWADQVQAKCSSSWADTFFGRANSKSCWNPIRSGPTRESKIILSENTLSELHNRAVAAGFSESDEVLVAISNLSLVFRKEKVENIFYRYPAGDNCKVYDHSNGKNNAILDSILPRTTSSYEKKCQDIKLDIAILLIGYMRETVIISEIEKRYGIKLDKAYSHHFLGVDAKAKAVMVGEVVPPQSLQAEGAMMEEFIGWMGQTDPARASVHDKRSGEMIGVIAHGGRGGAHAPGGYAFYPANSKYLSAYRAGKYGVGLTDTVKVMPMSQSNSVRLAGPDGTALEIAGVGFEGEFLKFHGVKAENIDERLRTLMYASGQASWFPGR